MKNFISVSDVENIDLLINKALEFKKSPLSKIGNNKTLGLIFFNPSLRTRMSTQKAAYNLGMNVMVMNVNSDSWQLEFHDGTVMDKGAQEHIKDAVNVMSSYCDILGVRSFSNLKDPEEDYNEPVMKAFLKYSSKPIISLESATLHPLQSLTDLVTIKEIGLAKPKIAVTWAPHPKVLPQAVTNSFLEWVKHIDTEVTLTHPVGFDLHKKFTEGFNVTNNQSEALENADIVYCKNWSSFINYGQKPKVLENWIIDEAKMALTNNAKFMHCMPIRRNVVATDHVINNSIIYQQAANREWAAQAVINEVLNTN